MSAGELIAGIVSGGITGTWNMASGIWNAYQGYKQQEYDREQDVITRSREDDAVQRRVEDLKKAGLSPVLAAGSPAQASHSKQSTPPHLERQDDIVGIMTALEFKEKIKAMRLENEKSRIEINQMKERFPREMTSMDMQLLESRYGLDTRELRFQILKNQKDSGLQHLDNEEIRRLSMIQQLARDRLEYTNSQVQAIKDYFKVDSNIPLLNEAFQALGLGLSTLGMYLDGILQPWQHRLPEQGGTLNRRFTP